MSSDKRLCPMCGEEIAAAAKKCKHCGEFLDGTVASSTPSAIAPTPAPVVESQEKAEGMIFCRGCGKKLHCSAVACPHCGAVQNSAAVSGVEKATDGVFWVPITSLVLGILCASACLDVSGWDNDTATGCCLFSVIGLVMGSISLFKQKKGRGMAIAGVVLSAISLLVYIGTLCK